MDNLGAFAEKNECPHDCGGYFIVRGNEKVNGLRSICVLILLNCILVKYIGVFIKVILIQEQAAMKRTIVEEDCKGVLTSHVTSSTHDGYRTRTDIVVNKGRYYLKHNKFQEACQTFTFNSD